VTGARIRDAVPGDAADAAAIAEIHNESVAAGDATMDEEIWTVDDVSRQQESFDAREGFLVLEDERGIHGWGIVKRYSDRAGYRFAGETAVFLRREMVRRGHGTRMKLALIERCRIWGYHHLVARILADNEASIEYNRRLGYEIVGRQREIGYRNGRWRDVVVMQLVLEAADGR
jgi:phosphinothricin acetyltransferase